MITDKLTFN